MFKITGKKGFHITFENGYTVSVQFGYGNYCENYNVIDLIDEKKLNNIKSKDAECAVWGKDGEFIKHSLFDGNEVGGRMSPAQVLELMNWAANQKD